MDGEHLGSHSKRLTPLSSDLTFVLGFQFYVSDVSICRRRWQLHAAQLSLIAQGFNPLWASQRFRSHRRRSTPTRPDKSPGGDCFFSLSPAGLIMLINGGVGGWRWLIGHYSHHATGARPTRLLWPEINTMPRFIHLSIWNAVDWRVKSSSVTMEAPTHDGRPEIGKRPRMWGKGSRRQGNRSTNRKRFTQDEADNEDDDVLWL